jgi:GTP-binding protein
VVDVDESRSFVVADIPGLIEGAHLGHGLGIKFLKHVERTKILLHLIDVSPYTGRNPVQDFRVVMKELEAFSPRLSKRHQIIAANKIDLLGEDKTRLKEIKDLARLERISFFAISSLKGLGVKEVVKALSETLDHLERGAA